MKVTFCGHSTLYLLKDESEKLDGFLLKCVQENPEAEFYLGGYGMFDNYCAGRLKKLKKEFKNIKLIYVTPYIITDKEKYESLSEDYDEILYPPIENVLKRFAILARNRYMVDVCDVIVACVKYPWGGAYKTLRYAMVKKKNYFNVGDL